MQNKNKNKRARKKTFFILILNVCLILDQKLHNTSGHICAQASSALEKLH